MSKYHLFTLCLPILFLFCACSHKTTTSTLQVEPISAITEGDYEIEKIAKDLTSGLGTVLHDKNFQLKDENSLDEVTLIKLDRAIRIILNGKIFRPDQAKPVKNAIYIIKELSEIIKNYPHLIIQVTGHSDALSDTKKLLDLSDNRAIAIANILYELDTKNETFAKGCGAQKPLFTKSADKDKIANARVEIFLYPNKKNMIDQCQLK